MKRENQSRNINLELYNTVDEEDTRYYGVFINGRGESRSVKVDPKRYCKFFKVPDDMKKVMDKRVGPYFHPAKREYLDYNTNLVIIRMREICEEWKSDVKPMIKAVLEDIKAHVFTFAEDDQYMSGILDATEASTNMNMRNMLAQEAANNKRNRLRLSLYAQYFHQMASQIEGLTLEILTRNNYEGEDFNRNVLYAFKGNKPESVRNLPGFNEYDTLYAVWNFIKHNSMSTYKALKSGYPEAVGEGEFQQGYLGCYWVKITDELIENILEGIELFLKRYCQLVFDEDEHESGWNFDAYFLSIVHEEIEGIINPLGIPFWV
jgi:hypothetical protein